MFRVFLEWDYGQDYLIFTSEENAINWINESLSELFLEDKNDNTEENIDCNTPWELYSELGLASINELKVI